MEDRYRLVEVIGNEETWNIKEIVTFNSLDEAAQMLLEAKALSPQKHYTLLEIEK